MTHELPRETIGAQARRTAAQRVKCRARFYARRPMTLDNLYPGLVAARPETLIAVAEHLLETERNNPRRWFGFGGEVNALNAKAALLLGRALRRMRYTGLETSSVPSGEGSGAEEIE